MRKRTVTVLLLALTTGIVGMGVVMSKSALSANASFTAGLAQPSATRPREVPQDRPGTINGAVNPELIPDRVAYSILFRLIANRNTDEERNRIKAYIRGMLGISCSSCAPLREAGRSVGAGEIGRTPDEERADIDAVFAAAEEFHRRVSLLDRQAAELQQHRRANPSLNVMPQLISLQEQKDAIVDAMAASLFRRLTAISRARLQEHINDHVKHRIKLTQHSPR